MYTHLNTCTHVQFAKIPSFGETDRYYMDSNKYMQNNAKKYMKRSLTFPETRPLVSFYIMLPGPPGVHHRRRPQDVTEMNRYDLY